MADRHDLHITIDDDGEVQIEVKGINGPQCVLITRELEEELGIVLSREKSSEYYKEGQTQTSYIQQEGKDS
jgi:8-oxo-dGTP pyrophosphatase MutT (NUDIX family)